MAEVWEAGVGLEWHFKFFEDLSVCLTAVWVTLFSASQICSSDQTQGLAESTIWCYNLMRNYACKRIFKTSLQISFK